MLSTLFGVSTYIGLNAEIEAKTLAKYRANSVLAARGKIRLSFSKKNVIKTAKNIFRGTYTD